MTRTPKRFDPFPLFTATTPKGQPMKTQALLAFIALTLASSAFAAGDKHDQSYKHKPLRLEATGSFKVGPGTRAVAVITVGGKPATARFTVK